MSVIIDGWGKGVVDEKTHYFFPNSGKAIRRDCSLGEFCVELTKETIAMINGGVSFETAVHSAFEWSDEWGGFNRSRDTAMAYTLINGCPVFIVEHMDGLSPFARSVYSYWLRINECVPEKKEQLLRDWPDGGRMEFPSMMEIMDRIEAGGRWER